MADPITRVECIHLQIPFKDPSHSPAAGVGVKDAILVAAETRDGRVGIGESSFLAEISDDPQGNPDSYWDDLTRRIAPGLLGTTFEEADEIAALAATWRGSGCRPSSIAGAETACWDLLAQSRHEILAEALGATEDRIDAWVPSGLTIGSYRTIVELLQAVEAHLDEGDRRVKLPIRPGMDLEVVHAVRQHFGDIPLMVDAGSAYGRDDIEVFRRLDAYQLQMIEQPLPADDLEGLAAIQAAIATPISLDATASDPARAVEAIRRKAGRIVNLKLQRIGGFGPALAIHDLCRDAGVACWVGTTPELGVGQAQGIHLAVLDNCKYPADVGPSARWFVDDYVVPAIDLAAPGILSVPTRPGLGYQVDPCKVRRYGVRRREFAAGQD